MDIEATKLELIDYLLKVEEKSILKKLSDILVSTDAIVTYSTDGRTFTKKQYIAHINDIRNSIKNGAKTYTTKELKKLILK